MVYFHKIKRKKMRNFTKPYGLGFRIGICILVVCVLFLVGCILADDYQTLTQSTKNNIADLWTIFILLAIIITVVGIPTTPSKH